MQFLKIKTTEIIDSIWDFFRIIIPKAASRKFIGWIIATIALFTGFIGENSWLAITMLMMGVQGILDWKTPTVPLIYQSRSGPNSTISEVEQEPVRIVP